MEPQNPPPKIACLADHDFLAISGTRNSYGLEMKNKGTSNGGGGGGGAGGSSPTVLGLNLELGRGGGSCNRHGSSKSSGFTFLQLQELEHQALIYNYIEAGLSVPYHLLLPIWKSVASSLTGLNSDLQQQYCPPFLGLGSLHHDYKNSMEPEPGRCRRTDGKKWRCSKDVVPNHKYCERHIHRGRHRSRKRVEAPPQLTTTTSSNPTSRGVQLSNTNL